MFGSSPVRALMASVLSLGLAAGCGSSPKSEPLSADPEESFRLNTMNEVGELLTVRQSEAKSPPASAKDLARYQAGWTSGYRKVNEGAISVFWNVPVEEAAAEKILAHEKSAPETGGFVLMQDGKTVKKLTADEFKAAPKAGKN